MQKTGFLLSIFILLAAIAVIPKNESRASVLLAYEKIPSPLPPDTGDVATTSVASIPTAAGTSTKDNTVVAVPVKHDPDFPARLVIPSISLNDKINKVGTNEKGEMDVPDGNSTDVGWYQFGTVPGEVGSAVIDAHVFAAFSKLKNISIGSSIYIETEAGKKLHFVVSDMQTYALKDVPADLLFNRADTARLNLITCAGKLTADHSTYDHRLVVYAALAE